MGNGGDPRPNVPLVNTNADALDQARGVIDRSTKTSYRRRQFSGLTGEQAGRDYVRRQYRGRIKREIQVPRRKWGDKAPILDTVFELDNGEFIVVEAKAGDSPMGAISKNRYVSDAQRGTRIQRGAVEIAQFTPEWFEAKLTEIARQDRRLANRIRKAWADGKLTPLLIRAPEHVVDIEHVIVENLADDWNRYMGVRSQARPPVAKAPAAGPVPTGPRKMLAAGPGAPAARPITDAAAPAEITDAERGLQSAETLQGAEAVAREEHVASAAFKALKPSGISAVVKAKSLAIGLKAWKATRTIGNVLLHLFVPLTPLDFVIEIGLLLWDLWNLRDDVNAKLKKDAFETVVKQKKAAIESEIQYQILDNPNTQGRYMRQWEEDRSFSGFLYGRVSADMISDDGGPNFVQKVAVSDTSTRHETTYTSKQYPGMKTVTSVFEWTMYPPFMTPFDIVLTKITNLFVDTLYFVGFFNGSSEWYMQLFEQLGGIHYTETYEDQYGEAIEFRSPLVAARCRYCLKYLHWAAGRLSHHPLVAEDLEGNLENPMKGWRRRHGILVKLLEGEGSGRNYRNNFSRFAESFNGLVAESSQTPEIKEALTSLYLGARSIWDDLQRIERNLSQPEYFYYGPNYKPGK